MEINVTKLKLKIKEKKTRKLTDEEKIMIDVCKFLGPKMDTKSLYNVCRDYLANRGIIFTDGFISELETPYSTTTIRDATPKEVIAWYTLQSLYVCSHNMPIQLCKHCANNLGPDGCYIDRTRGRAEEILKGKEVILSVNEE